MVREGVPTALVSIPLKYMHTSVETVSLKDIQKQAVLAQFVIGLTEVHGGLKCFYRAEQSQWDFWTKTRAGAYEKAAGKADEFALMLLATSSQ